MVDRSNGTQTRASAHHASEKLKGCDTDSSTEEREHWVGALGIWLRSFLKGAVAGSSFGVSPGGVGLLVSAGLILRLIPVVGAAIALFKLAAG